MFIDRSFKKIGFGNVVTGTVSSGEISIGDKLKILPQNKTVKVRGLQSHDNATDSIRSGDRGAINLHSLDKIDIKRGNHLSNINFINSTDTAIVKINIYLRVKIKLKIIKESDFY